MNVKLIRSAAIAVLALGAGLGPSAAFAQVGYPGAAIQGQRYGYVHGRHVRHDRIGHFSCGYNELHTRLERKNCGGTHYRY